ncbi:hypothetical protein HRR83_000428 [Exophiala dermatitidis]|uniref:Uncharacterized protein n=1 Tax=Exophiala dermatitidis TaxID=5970 RepID=A0AAN6IYS5_EXODE|nr:hypothetical protein HRR74_000430 [Exophiala dermatitidis]KAJ4528311.1 hypothetical protein HRR73_000934 [Exophiala dermatitidis]KAJ4531259.1 hypothetical protein HRR76_008927 [Exophiala dermatitidis]KAJ4558421.1 hypothetical protein HRR77_000429 [Exophiala dermatitidis]KAJ4581542.1 hypothetical protein HRR79_000566 [Exophiala dermatitidis]
MSKVCIFALYRFYDAHGIKGESVVSNRMLVTTLPPWLAWTAIIESKPVLNGSPISLSKTRNDHDVMSSRRSGMMASTECIRADSVVAANIHQRMGLYKEVNA